MRQQVTLERLKELLSYDPITGEFKWNRSGKGRRLDLKAGNLLPCGYVQLCIDCVKYYGHRLAWFYVHGEWPNEEIDHIDGVKSNNKIVNLREADSSLNKENTHHAHRRSKTGLLGVSVNNYGYAVRITVKGKRRTIGNYKTPELAHEAYLKAKRELHAGCTI